MVDGGPPFKVAGGPVDSFAMRPLIAVLAAGLLSALVPAAASADKDPTAVFLSACKQIPTRCYDVDQVRHAYGIDRLRERGLDGSGVTVAIIMAPSPTLAVGLQTQSALYGLPPAQLAIATPAGDPGSPGSFSDQVEPNLDVQAVHAIAPAAKLLFLAVPGSRRSTTRVLGDAALAKAVDAAVASGADVISMSFGGVERRYPRFRAALARAGRAGVASFAGSGDEGVTLPGRKGRQTFYPAADANVTSVGGTLVTLDRKGRRLAPDVAWGPDANGGASGGGVSKLTPLPSWQRGLANVHGKHRHYPDISMLAAQSGSFVVLFPEHKPNWDPIGGTSVATPLMAGVAALARQAAGRPLRHVNAALYRLARNRQRNGIVDVVVGNNGYSAAANGAASGFVPGYLATPGYDLVTGLGTVDPTRFVPALARAAR